MPGGLVFLRGPPPQVFTLTDAEWAVIAPLLPARDPARGGRPLVHDRRQVVDSILYVLRTGCAWRLIPHGLAPWHAAYRWFRAWTAPAHAEAMIRMSMIRLMAARLGGEDVQPHGPIETEAAQSLAAELNDDGRVDQPS